MQEPRRPSNTDTKCEEHKDKLDTLIRKVDEVHFAVIGNERLGTLGLVRRVQKLETWSDNLNLKIAGLIGLTAAAVFIAEHVLKLF